MSIEACVEFEKLVLNQPELQKKLRETPDEQEFWQLAVQLGKQHGLYFSYEEARSQL
jgi:hypothetical protein